MRSLEGVCAEGVADLVRGRTLLEPLHELVVDARLDVDAGAGTAALAVVEEDAEVDPRDGILDVGVVEDDVRRLASELEGDLLQVGAGGSLHHLTTDDGGTGERHLVHVHVRGDGGARHLSKAGDDVDHARGEAGLLDEGGGHQGGEGRLLGRLEDDRVPRGDGRADLPCPHEQGEVPGDDLTADANLV